MKVRIHHEATGNTAVVPESTARVLRRSGWTVVEAPAVVEAPRRREPLPTASDVEPEPDPFLTYSALSEDDDSEEEIDG